MAARRLVQLDASWVAGVMESAASCDCADGQAFLRGFEGHFLVAARLVFWIADRCCPCWRNVTWSLPNMERKPKPIPGGGGRLMDQTDGDARRNQWESI